MDAPSSSTGTGCTQRNAICRVGYAFNEKKLRAASVSAADFDEEVKEEKEANMINQEGPWCGGGLATIVGVALRSSEVVDGVVFIPIDESRPPEKVDIILHKLTGDIVKAIEGHESPRLQVIKSIIAKNPNVGIVDQIESVGLVVSRLKTSERIANLLTNRLGSNKRHSERLEALFNQPKFTLVSNGDSDLEGIMKTNCLSFPVICKPERACGVAESHHMNIVLDMDGFEGVQRPFVMQQYYNHNAVFHKVYVIGDWVMMFRRPSLPNFSVEQGVESRKERIHVIPFDSRKSYPTLENLHGCGITISNDTTGVDESNPCNQEQLEGIAQSLSDCFGLSLFGFDIIAPTVVDGRVEDRPLLIVDVNFFPSYKEVPDFPFLLRAHLRKRAGFTPYEA